MINTSLDKVTANGNGVATVFSFSPVTIFNSSDLTVTFVSVAGVETVLTEGVGTANYSVSLTTPSVLPSTGSITYPASGGGHLASGESLVIARIVDLLQETDLGNQGGYFPEVQEAAFDYAMMVDIQQQDLIDRSMKLPTHVTGVSVELPNPVAGQGLIWNGGATALTSAVLTLTADISNALIVVSAVQPGLVNGRIWIDTSIGGNFVVRICDGTDYNSEIIRVNNTTNAVTVTNAETNNAAVTVNLAAAGTPLTLSVTDPGANGVVEISDHSSVSPAINDIIWSKQFKGRDSATNVEVYAEDRVTLQGVTSGVSESAIRSFRTEQGAGIMADRVKIGAGMFTPAQVDKGTDTINTTSLYMGGTLMAASDVSIQSGATHAPTLSDHGKTFIYTNAGVCAVTIPTAAGLFPGWKIYQQMATGSGGVTNNRSSTDTLWSKNTSLTTLRLLSPGDGGSLTLDSTGGTAKFYWNGKRSASIADSAITLSATTVSAHNLGVIPDTVKINIVNTIANANYAPGDVVDPTTFASAAAASGYNLSFDATNVIIYQGPQMVAIANKTTWATTVLTAADWNFRYTNISVIN